ncbi:MAG TPA: ABC transporter permease [Euzebyales bacterium]
MSDAMAARQARRTSGPALVGAQVVYAVRAFLRNRASVVLALGLPLTFLVVFGLMVGNETISAESDVRVAQYLAPVAVVFAVAMITFSALPTGVARARERGILKRLHGTPLPWSDFLVGRVGAAVVISLAGVAVLLAVGVLAYDVQLFGRTAGALVVTLVVGIACFAALGLAAVALLGPSTVVEAVTSGCIVILAFISGIFVVGTDMPPWLDRVGSFFPLKHFVDAMTTAFDPFGTGTGLSPDHLAVMAAWGVVGLVVAARFFRWAPPVAVGGRTGRGTGTDTVGPRSMRHIVAGQVRYADAALWRDPGGWFFGLAFPVLLLVLMPLLFGEEVRIGGRTMAEILAAGMPVYAIAVVAYVVQASAVAKARDRGVLKRLGGTPLPGWAYVAGRIGSTLWISAADTVVILAVAAGLHDVTIHPAAVPGLALAVLVGGVSLAALGLALAALVPRSSSVDAIALGTLLPVALLSGLFPVAADYPPAVRDAIALLPLSPFRQAVADALASTTTPEIAWTSLSVMVAWGVVAALVATRLLRREPAARRRATSAAVDGEAA